MLHVCTAVTRPENLSRIAESLRCWVDSDFCWHLRFDWKQEHIGGQALKNVMLDEIDEGWIWFLDDDTIAHKRLPRYLAEAKAIDAKALVVSQRREDRTILHAAPENLRVDGIDIGQAVIRRELIGDHRIPEIYAGDGDFLSAVLSGRDDVLFVDKILSYHNALA